MISRSAITATFFLLCLVCGACGFHPVYGVNQYQAVGVENHMAQTQIANIPDREGQILHNHLIDRFHKDGAQPAIYTLTLSPVREALQDLDITRTSDSTRSQLRLTSVMRLQDVTDGTILLERPLTSIVSYNILSSEFSTRISENNARQNGLNDMANQIETIVSLHFKRASDKSNELRP